MLNSLLHQFGVLTTFVILFILIQVYTPGWPDTVIPQFVKRILNEAGDTFIRIYWKPEVNGIIIGMTNQCCSTTLFRWGHLPQVTCGGYYQLQCHLMGWLKHYTLQPELLLLRNKNVTINYCDILMMCKTDFGLIYGINTQEMKCWSKLWIIDV